MRKGVWNGGLTVMLAAGILWAFALPAYGEPVFPEGVSVDGQSLAGMTAEEARDAVKAYVGSQGQHKVTLSVEGRDVETTSGELGYHWANEQVVDEAAAEYAGGSLIRQYMAKKDLAESPVDLPLEVGVASSSVAQFVNTQCQDMGTAPQNASIARENGAFVITESIPGKTVDAEATGEALNQALAQGLDEAVRVEAVIMETEPEITTEDLASIQDVLGTATTSFSSSGAARSTNVSVGASKINGRVLMPGEVLSGYECLQPFTSANGYKGAASYANGQVVDLLGSTYSDSTELLNGNQAVAYGRIREIDSDDARVSRQQRVLQALVAQLKKKNIFQYPGLVREVAYHCETSLGAGKLLSLSPIVLRGLSLETLSIPGEEEAPYGGYTDSGSWVYIYDTELAAQHISRFIYEEDSPYYTGA